MENRGKYKQNKFENDLDRGDHDPNFDLDAYIQEQSTPGNINSTYQKPPEDDSSQFKNALLIFVVFAAAFLWFNEWSPSQAWSSLTGGEQTSAEIAPTAPGLGQLEINIPDIPAPPTVPAAPTASQLDLSITEYLSILRDKGYLGDEISGFSARELYDANVPISYLDQLQQAGFLEDLSFVYITNYYQNQIPLAYLESLQEAGVYDELSFVDVTEFYNNNIPTDYLVKLNEAGYLEDLSFVYITNFYQAGVTIEFLDQLKEQDLYEDLNFLDIIDLYKRENGG